MGSISAPALRDELINAAAPGFDAEIDSESDDALAYEARQQQEAEVMVDLLAVEFGEAALV
jgi:hypothetical protein